MNRPSTGSLVGGVVVCHLVGFVAFALSALAGSPPTLLPIYLWPHALLGALLRLAENVPALSAAGVMAGCSIFTGRRARADEPVLAPVDEVVRPSLILLLVLALLYVGVSGYVTPLLWSRVTGMERSSLLAAQHLKDMQEAERRAERSGSAADWRASYEAANRYLLIDTENAQLREHEVALEGAYIEARRAEESLPVAAAAAATEPGDGPSLLRRAMSFYDAGDYYSAHYYASLAGRFAEVRSRAAALLAEAEKQISPDSSLEEKGSAEDRAAAELTRRKREVFASYEQGDWLSAYYGFGELAEIYPRDTDIARYHELSKAKALEQSFWIGEAREALEEGGSGDLLFAVDRGARGTELVSIRSMAVTASGTYFADVEALRFAPGRGVTLHLYAPYGKLSQGVILLNAIDPDVRERSQGPRVSIAADPGELTVALEPGYDPALLGYIDPDPASLRGVPAGTLWGMRGWASSSGMLGEAVDLELLLFFARPVLFLTLGVFCLAAAWRLRARYYAAPPAGAYLAVLLFPLVMAGVWALLADGSRLLWAEAVELAGFAGAAVAAGVVHGIALAAGLLLLARSALDEGQGRNR